MMDLKTLTSLLVRGADAARAEAERVLAELRARGDVSAEEAREIEKGVREAIESNQIFLEENVLNPLRGLLGGLLGRRAAEQDAILQKLADLERKLDELEGRAGEPAGPPPRHKKSAAAERRGRAKPRRPRG